MDIDLTSMDTDSMSPEEREAILVVTAYRALRDKFGGQSVSSSVLLQFIQSNVVKDATGRPLGSVQDLQPLKKKLAIETLSLEQLERAIESIREKGVDIDVVECEKCNDSGRLKDVNRTCVSLCTCSRGKTAFWESLARDP